MANVTVEPHLFDQQGERHEPALGGGWETSPTFLVVSDNRDKAAEATAGGCSSLLFRRSERHGTDPAEMTGEFPQYTPNYVSDVYLTDLGPLIHADTKGELSTGMADGMLRILEPNSGRRKSPRL